MPNLDPKSIKDGFIIRDKFKLCPSLALINRKGPYFDAYTEDEWEYAEPSSWYVFFGEDIRAINKIKNKTVRINPEIIGDAYKEWNKWETTRPLDKDWDEELVEEGVFCYD